MSPPCSFPPLAPLDRARRRALAPGRRARRRRCVAGLVVPATPAAAASARARTDQEILARVAGRRRPHRRSAGAPLGRSRGARTGRPAADGLVRPARVRAGLVGRHGGSGGRCRTTPRSRTATAAGARPARSWRSCPSGPTPARTTSRARPTARCRRGSTPRPIAAPSSTVPSTSWGSASRWTTRRGRSGSPWTCARPLARPRAGRGTGPVTRPRRRPGRAGPATATPRPSGRPHWPLPPSSLVRRNGDDRVGTSLAVSRGVSDPGTVLLASAVDPDRRAGRGRAGRHPRRPGAADRWRPSRRSGRRPAAPVAARPHRPGRGDPGAVTRRVAVRRRTRRALGGRRAPAGP